jgi:hypothetical protein
VVPIVWSPQNHCFVIRALAARQRDAAVAGVVDIRHLQQNESKIVGKSEAMKMMRGTNLEYVIGGFSMQKSGKALCCIHVH